MFNAAREKVFLSDDNFFTGAKNSLTKSFIFFFSLVTVFVSAVFSFEIFIFSSCVNKSAPAAIIISGIELF